MNPQWNTPPNGDFASYVERLSAQAALPRREPQEGEHGLDIGMTPSSQPHSAVADAAAAARRSASSNGEAPRGSSAAHNLARVLAIVWVTVLALLLVLKVSFVVVIAVLAFGLWAGYRLRRWALPPGVGNWRQWLEEEAKKQKQRQQQGRSK
ncbi:MAG: hypothetical protein EOP82_21760 [Variovorax sp.]|nr:MAG: hypothetical protein EOP82_21760 [Variovorax sp.]